MTIRHSIIGPCGHFGIAQISTFPFGGLKNPQRIREEKPFKGLQLFYWPPMGLLYQRAYCLRGYLLHFTHRVFGLPFRGTPIGHGEGIPRRGFNPGPNQGLPIFSWGPLFLSRFLSATPKFPQKGSRGFQNKAWASLCTRGQVSQFLGHILL